MMGRVWWLVILWGGGLLAAQPRIDTIVTPNTLTIGSVVTVTHIVTGVPANSQVHLTPLVPLDEAKMEAAIAGVTPSYVIDNQRVIVQQAIRLFSVGDLVIPAQKLTVKGPKQRASQVFILPSANCFVMPIVEEKMTALEHDATLFHTASLTRTMWLQCGVLIALLVGGMYGVYRYRIRHKQRSQERVPDLDTRSPYQRAIDTLAQAYEQRQALGIKSYYTQYSVCVKQYVGALFAYADQEVTTAELLHRVRRFLSVEKTQELADLLTFGDHIKFAAQQATDDQHTAYYTRARSLIQVLHRTYTIRDDGETV